MADEKSKKVKEELEEALKIGVQAVRQTYPVPVDAKVQLRRSEILPKPAQTFWAVIRNRTIDFNKYKKFIDDVMCCVCDPLLSRGELSKEDKLDLRLPFPGVRAYNLLKLATELYMMQECGVACFKEGLGRKDRKEGDYEPCIKPQNEFEDRFKPAEEAERMGRDPIGVS